MENLRILCDQELLLGCDRIVKAENKITRYGIAYLAEIDRRRMFSREHESLHHFLTKRYGYTSGSAQRRIDAVRLYREIPEVAE